MTDAVDDGAWQTSQTVVGGRGWAEISEPVRRAIGPVDTTTSRWLLVDGSRSDRNGGLTTVVFRVGEAISWDGFEGNLGWSVLQPGLPALTTDLLAGREVRWSGSFTAAGRPAQPATATIRPETDADLACLGVRAEVELAGGAVTDVTYRFRWCRGTGLTGWSITTSGVVAGFEDAGGESLPSDVDLTAAPPGKPVGGRTDEVRFFRQVGQSLTGYEMLNAIQVRQAGYATVIADSEGTLTGWRALPAQGDARADFGLLWRARPGGSIRGLVALGDLTVVGTTDRRVVAYQSSGAVLWSRSVPDAILGVAARDGVVVVAEASGSLLGLDARTGRPTWSAQVGQLDRSPVAGGADGLATVAVVTEDAVQLRDLATGAIRWSVAADPRATEVAVAGTLVVVRTDGWLIARDARDATVRWTRPVATSALLGASPELIVAFARSGTEAVDPGGVARWTAVATESGFVRDNWVLLTTPDRLEVRNRDGSSTTWAYPTGLTVPEFQPGPVGTGDDGGLLALQRSPTRKSWWLYR